MAGIESIHESIPSDLLVPMLEEFRTGWELRKIQSYTQKKLMGELNKLHHGHVEGLGSCPAESQSIHTTIGANASGTVAGRTRSS